MPDFEYESEHAQCKVAMVSRSHTPSSHSQVSTVSKKDITPPVLPPNEEIAKKVL